MQGWLLPLFIPNPTSLIRAKNRFVKNGTANFSWNIPTEISGPLPGVIPNLWHTGKHPVFSGKCQQIVTKIYFAVFFAEMLSWINFYQCQKITNIMCVSST